MREARHGMPPLHPYYRHVNSKAISAGSNRIRGCPTGFDCARSGHSELVELLRLAAKARGVADAESRASFAQDDLFRLRRNPRTIIYTFSINIVLCLSTEETI